MLKVILFFCAINLLFFKQRLGNVGIEDSCNCSNLFHEKTCQSCQTFCYVLNFIADKLIVDRKTEVCNFVELTHINDYFCLCCKRTHLSVGNQIYKVDRKR